MASLLPGKNHEDVRLRYQRLMYDVHKIENSIAVSAERHTSIRFSARVGAMVSCPPLLQEPFSRLSLQSVGENRREVHNLAFI